MAQAASSIVKALVGEMIQKVLNEQNWDAASEYLAEDVEMELLHRHIRGIEEYKEVAKSVVQGFPNVRYEIFEVICEGNQLAFRWEGRGRHEGEIWGVAPTNKKIVWTGLSMFELEGSKVKRGWIYSNLSALLRGIQG